jgi:hypothetical protein
MDSKEFKKMGQLLGVSLKAVRSYEQGWRSIPTHAERQMFFLLSRVEGNQKDRKACWVIKKCPPEIKKQCPAWEFQAGKLCWFINGTICCGDVCKDWKDKMKCCRSCEVFKSFL